MAKGKGKKKKNRVGGQQSGGQQLESTRDEGESSSAQDAARSLPETPVERTVPSRKGRVGGQESQQSTRDEGESSSAKDAARSLPETPVERAVPSRKGKNQGAASQISYASAALQSEHPPPISHEERRVPVETFSKMTIAEPIPSTRQGGENQTESRSVVRTQPISRGGEPGTSSVLAAATSYSETEVDAIARGMKKFGLELTHKKSSYIFAQRPGVGKLGKKINLYANYFEIEIPEGEIYHYDVDIIRTVAVKDKVDTHKRYKCLNTKMNRNIIEELIKKVDMFKNFRPAYDGEKNLYTRNRLPFKDIAIFTLPFIDDFGREEKFEIKLKPVIKKDKLSDQSAGNSISLEPLHQLMRGKCRQINDEIIIGVMALETILRHGPALRLVPVGRSFFQKPRADDIPPLGSGREIWFGHHQNMQLTGWKPMLNLDRSATTFYKGGPLTEFMLEILYPNVESSEVSLRQIRSLTDANRKVLKKELKRLKIQVTHMSYPRKYRVYDISKEAASNTFFKKNEGNKEITISVSDYFRKEYRALRYPNLPCIDVGSDKRSVYLPMEVCEIVQGQHCNKKLSDKQTAQMIRYTAQPPAERFREIQNSVRSVIEDFEPFRREFGIKIQKDPLRFEGRVLAPPKIQYSHNQTSLPINGSWDMKDKIFHTPVKINKWVLINFSTARFCNENALANFVNMLCNGGSKTGISFAPPLKVESYTRRDGRPSDIIRNTKKIDRELQLAIVVLPGTVNIYSEIKSVAEIELGLMTQCIKDENMTGRKCNTQLICNLCQKINAKLGGINNSLTELDKPPILKKPIIIIGADCCHPSPGDPIGYSISSVVGSMDSYPSKFRAAIRVQQPKIKEGIRCGQDIIVNMKEMVKELLMAFYDKTRGKKPEKIIFFRDGASEGEFKKIMEYEVLQIRKACEEMARNEMYKPPITYIVVGKRHHTRFQPVDRGMGVGKHCNIPPGTTVDTKVVHPVFYDYYLCSHTGIQGTSRPAHYTVLWDDNNFTADDLQLLTYKLCHTYVRCTRSVSLPCPVMYADLAAYRAKQYLLAKLESVSSSSDSQGSEEQDRIISESIQLATKVVDNMQNRMYFV